MPQLISEVPSPDSVAHAFSHDHDSIDTVQDNDDDLDSPAWNYTPLEGDRDDDDDDDDSYTEEQVGQSREHQLDNVRQPSFSSPHLHQSLNHSNSSTTTTAAATHHPLPLVEPILPHPTTEERTAGMVMTEERKVAVLNAMKGVSMEYRPHWAGNGGDSEGKKKGNRLQDG